MTSAPSSAEPLGTTPLRSSAAPDPMAIAASWLPTNDDPDRPQITLSTVGADGWPSARTVLLTELGPEGFSFHTDAYSRKVADLTAEPRCALTVLWPGFTRQLVVQGIAEVASEENLAGAFARRSPYLQQLAWLNSAEFAVLPLEDRRARWASFAAEHGDGVPQPERWTGFLVRPTRMLFWTSAQDTASRREEYTLADGTWSLAYLPG